MNINEIATLAGVSRATVSRYLNNGYVSEQKRAAIARVIGETGYVPSSHAQTLRTGRSHLVGVIIPKINSESVSRMVAGITDVLEESGYHVVLANTDNDDEAEIQYLRVLADRKVDGIILIATVLDDAHHAALAELTVPHVILGQRAAGITCVYFDDYQASYDLTQGLYGSCDHPAHLGVTDLDEAAGRLRLQAFIDAMEAEDVKREDMLIERGEFTIESGREMAARVLREHPEVNAMVCATDSIAAGALAALRDAGKRVPEDVQVTGIGDTEISRAVYPSLTTAHYHYRSSGRQAASLLLAALDGDSTPHEVRMGYQLLLRGSTIND